MDRDSVDVIDAAGRCLCHLLLTNWAKPGTPAFQRLWELKGWVSQSHSHHTTHYPGSSWCTCLPACLTACLTD